MANQPLPPTAAAAEPTGRPTTPARTIDPLSSWRNHRWLMGVLAIGVLALGLPTAWSRGKPTYYAEAALRVSPAYVRNLEDQADLQFASNTQYNVFVQQQVATIRSFDVALAALNNLGPRRSLWQRAGETDRRAAERLMATIQVRPVRETYLVVIGLDGPKPDGLADIVNAVAAAAVEKTGEEGLYGTDIRIRRLDERRAGLQTEIAGAVAQLEGISSELGVSTFDDSSLNPLDSRLVAISEALADWRRRRIAAEAKLRTLDEAQKREQELELDSAARELLEKDLAVSSSTKLYYDKRNALLAQASGLSPNHPGYQAVQRQLAEIDAEQSRVVATQFAATKAQLEQRKRTEAAAELSRARMEADQARQVEEQLAVEYAADQGRLAEYTTKYQEALGLVGDIRRNRKRIELISNRIDSLSLESQAPGFIRLASPARVPEQPMAGGRKKLLMLVAVAAVGLAAAVPLALDRLDPRIRVPADVEKALGFPPLGWIPDRTNPQTTALAVDQRRRLALMLAREREKHGTTRLTLVGTSRGAGTTTLTLELAHELQHLGLRVLAVEANSLHTDRRFAGENRSAGLGTPLLDVGEAIVRGADGEADRLPLGNVPAGRLLATLAAVARKLHELAQRYDVLLIDGPPLLCSAEGEALVQLGDGALLVVGANLVTGGDVTRAARALERVAPPVVGVVVNRVRVEANARSFAGLLPERGPVAGGLGATLWRIVSG